MVAVALQNACQQLLVITAIIAMRHRGWECFQKTTESTGN
jgi:hypothetical protein